VCKNNKGKNIGDESLLLYCNSFLKKAEMLLLKRVE
jgi:hypothetical protein